LIPHTAELPAYGEEITDGSQNNLQMHVALSIAPDLNDKSFFILIGANSCPERLRPAYCLLEPLPGVAMKNG